MSDLPSARPTSTRPAEVMVPTVNRTLLVAPCGDITDESRHGAEYLAGAGDKNLACSSQADVSAVPVEQFDSSSFSRSLIWALKADWETCNRDAARLKCLSSATARA